jgi:hypothetical protein
LYVVHTSVEVAVVVCVVVGEVVLVVVVEVVEDVAVVAVVVELEVVAELVTGVVGEVEAGAPEQERAVTRDKTRKRPPVMIKRRFFTASPPKGISFNYIVMEIKKHRLIIFDTFSLHSPQIWYRKWYNGLSPGTQPVERKNPSREGDGKADRGSNCHTRRPSVILCFPKSSGI